MQDVEQFEQIGDGLLVRAPAKINLSLLIAGKRPDGYHELETIMAKIDWCDEVVIEPGDRPGVELVCKGPEWAPQSEENLVYRAADAILRRCGQTADLRLTLVKNVPAGTGLGSASSDAAATLLGLNKHLDLGLSAASLADLAARLGSDVAFFLDGPLALCTGRGEEIQRLSVNFPFAAVLFLLPISVPTKTVYANYVHDAELYERWRRQIYAHLRDNRVDFIAGMCANMLQRTCLSLFEELGELRKALESLHVAPICLSGSGSALFHIVAGCDVECLEKLQDTITDRTGCRTVVVRNNQW